MIVRVEYSGRVTGKTNKITTQFHLFSGLCIVADTRRGIVPVSGKTMVSTGDVEAINEIEGRVVVKIEKDGVWVRRVGERGKGNLIARGGDMPTRNASSRHNVRGVM